MAAEPKDEPKELDPFGRPIDHFGIGMKGSSAGWSQRANSRPRRSGGLSSPA
jgi:hypothetical protein